MGSSTDWKLTGSQRLTTGVRVLSPTSNPHSRARIWHWEKEPPKHLALKASGACAQELHRTGGNETPFLKGTHRLSRALGSRAKQSLQRNLVKPDCSSWRTSWENRGECGLLWGKDIGSKALRNIQQHAFLWRWPFWEDLASPISTEKPQAKQQSRRDHSPTH